MSAHLTTKEIRAFLARRTKPADLIRVTDHLAACSSCQALTDSAALPIRQIRQALAPVHLTDDQLSRYAESRVGDGREDKLIRAHIAACRRCRDEANDLRSFALGLPPQKNWRPLWMWWSAAAVTACLAAFFFVPRTPRSVTAPATVTQATATSLPADLRALRDAAISTGHVAVPPGIAALAGREGTLLGENPPPPVVRLTAPLGTATLSARPSFTWTAAPGADWYQVSVFDTSFRKVADSGRIEVTNWEPPTDLASGQIYVWQVTVSAHGNLTTAPRPPAPEARFQVLDRTESARLAALAVRYPAEHALLGVLYAKAGAVDAARREFLAAGLPDLTQ